MSSKTIVGKLDGPSEWKPVRWRSDDAREDFMLRAANSARIDALERLWAAIKAADESGIGYSPETAEACKALRELDKI